MGNQYNLRFNCVGSTRLCCVMLERWILGKDSMQKKSVFFVPEWVPDTVQRYLAHTAGGQSIRDLARRLECHASTILRQVRRIETRRDDPLIDQGLAALERDMFKEPSQRAPSIPRDALDQDLARVLRRLCETGAVLAVAEGVETLAVLRSGQDGNPTRTASVTRAVAQMLAIQDWITCVSPGRVRRYHVTPTGRTALRYLMAEIENRARASAEVGFAESQTSFEGAGVGGFQFEPGSARYNLAESPLAGLARRKDKDGRVFLTDDLVRAGERLREDFELSQMGPNVAQNWESFLTGPVSGSRGNAGSAPVGMGPQAAKDRVAQALSDLGPGLSDVVLRCCCYLEGLAVAEKRMGWSARSGKIVLRIALQRLKRHYDELSDAQSMIG